MRYRRVLLVADLGGDSRTAIATIRRIAPDAERLVIVASLPPRKIAWLSREAPADLQEAAHGALEVLRAAGAGAAPTVDIELAPDLSAETLDEVVISSRIDLLVGGSWSFSSVPVVTELRKRRSVAVLWVPAQTRLIDRPLAEVLCVALGNRARAAIAAFLRDHGDAAQHATVLTTTAAVPLDLAMALDVAGVHTTVEVLTPDESLRSWLDDRMRARKIDLLVFARFPTALLLGARWPIPTLLLPPAPVPGRLRAGIDAPDLVDDGGPVRVRLEYAVGVGRRTPIADQDVAFVSGGRVVAVVRTADGEAELPADLHAGSYGVFRTAGRTVTDPVAAVEGRVAVIRPGSSPLVLFDAELSEEELCVLHRFAASGGYELLAVRMRPIRSSRSIRDRLHASGVPPRVIDASLVLDEGTALDVPDVVDAVRLARVGARMRGGGFPVAAIVYRGAKAPATISLAALRANELADARLAPVPPVAQPAMLTARLDATTGASLLPGNRVEIELDNARARRWLLEASAASTRRIHLQVYMWADDDVGRQAEAALAQAAGRGVAVRVLVDSLHGLHGSFGARNPLLERLGARTGVELRVSHPVTGLPSLEDLKQRDHRKLVVIDNRLALLGGRNLSHEYYTGFDEAVLTPRSMWRDVPWLDAGARVQGPAVAALERSFLEAWSDAGGDAFDVADVPPAGPVPARIVLHRGLRDAHTLQAYLALIETARSHVDVVNGFPLVLEIQHALLRALRRGVRVRALFGHLTPTHHGEPFRGPWSSARTAATWLVHSRMDALIAAGGEGYQFAVPEQPGWETGLGTVRTHVHAKVMSADGRACAVGSANLDITAGYWESELLLIVEDAALAAAIESRIDELLAASVRVDRDDPQWQQLARRRAWMRHWPGVLSV